MIIEKIDPDKYHKILRHLFYGDNDWINNYQNVSGHVFTDKGLNKVVSKTIEDINVCDNYEFYVIKKDREPLAYFGKEDFNGLVFMTGFYVKIKYRTKEFISYFWDVVEQTMNHEPVYCNIMKKNIIASHFLLKKGSVVIDKNDILTFKIL